VAADYLQTDYKIGVTRACGLVQISRSSYGYQSRRPSDAPLRLAIRKKAQERKRWGYRRLQVLLQREGHMDNHKRIHRIYKEEGLQVRKRRRKRARTKRSFELLPSDGPNQRWSIDFMHDSTASGRKLRILNVVDDYTREALWMEVSSSISGQHVTRVLDQLIELYGKPQCLLTDNGPEFVGSALDAWTYDRKIKHQFIQPGKPNQNAYVESFNGRVRDECLNEHWWRNIDHARDQIEIWREDYNHVRPHGSLNKQTPAAFAEKSRAPLGGQGGRIRLATTQPQLEPNPSVLSF
jgi:putative transposase